jgi:hypothetical protein
MTAAQLNHSIRCSLFCPSVGYNNPASTRAGVSPVSKNGEPRHFTENSGARTCINVEKPKQRDDGLIRSLRQKWRYRRTIVIVSVPER